MVGVVGSNEPGRARESEVGACWAAESTGEARRGLAVIPGDTDTKEAAKWLQVAAEVVREEVQNNSHSIAQIQPA